MSFLVLMILVVAKEVIPAIFGMFMYFFIFKTIFPPKAKKPKELRANEHVYYPMRFFISVWKLSAEYILMIAFLTSFRLWSMSYWSAGKNVAIGSLTIGLILIFLPFERKVKRVIVDAKGVTIEYRYGASVSYSPQQYVKCEKRHLVFQDAGGAQRPVSFRFLCMDDRYAVGEDLNALKQTGKFPAAAKLEEAQKKADQQFHEEKQRLYANTKRYAAYLQKEAAERLTGLQMQELVRMIKSGDKMNAIKRCREWTGLGLKEAKDMVDQYRICFVDDAQTDQVKSNAKIKKLDEKYNPKYLPTSEANGLNPASGGGVCWKLRITDREQVLSEQERLESLLDKILSDISMRREEFVVLVPPVPQLGIAFVQARLDHNGVLYHVEVGYTEQDAQGHSKILYKDGLMSWDVRDVFVAFRKSAKVETDGWQRL